MFHYVYRITRPSTGEWYIGIRSCDCHPTEDVGYMGSGTLVTKKVEAHPTAFSKRILAIVETRTEAARLEGLLVGPEQVEEPECLNLRTGGENDWTTSEETKRLLSEAQKGKKHSEETKRRISENNARVWLARERGPMSETQKGKISESLRGHKRSEETKGRMSEAQRGNTNSKGRKHSEETKAKMRAAWARRKENGK